MPVLGAAVLAAGYAVVLVAVAAGLLVELIGGIGHIGAEHLDALGQRGVVFVAVLMAAGATLLVGGSVRLLRGGTAVLLVLPLALVLVIGCIGETVDVIGNASTASNLVGGGILLLAALPIAFTATPAARRWARDRRGRQR